MGTRGAIPIILLPGMDGTGELLRAVADQLSIHRPVQALAYPLDRPLGYDQLVAYVLDRAPNVPFVILGESFSGPIAIEIAAKDLRAVGLVLVSSFARHPLPTAFALFARFIDLRWLPMNIVAAALMGPTATPELSDQLRRTLAKLPREIIRTRAYEVLRVDKRDRLRQVPCPVLCLHGRRDRFLGRRHVNEIVASQPSCQVRWLDAPHMLLETHPEAAAEAINYFCDQLKDLTT